MLVKESYDILKNCSYKFDCKSQKFACPLRLVESGQLTKHQRITNFHMHFHRGTYAPNHCQIGNYEDPPRVKILGKT